ncbi:MAG: Hsp20/alpha crystallin family protein [Smithellaceae bacterium]|nr:Hsp20/alpha crystallin family protein [Smithellaceae bacterium]
MNRIKIRFRDDLGKVEADFRRSVHDMFQLVTPVLTHCHRIWRPQLDIYETPDAVIIVAEIAGVKREDLFVEIGRRSIKIHGNRCERYLTEGTKYALAEIPYGDFERNISFPMPINVDTAIATYAEGLLQIRVEKLPTDKVHKINITSG